MTVLRNIKKVPASSRIFACSSQSQHSMVILTIFDAQIHSKMTSHRGLEDWYKTCRKYILTFDKNVILSVQNKVCQESIRYFLQTHHDIVSKPQNLRRIHRWYRIYVYILSVLCKS